MQMKTRRTWSMHEEEFLCIRNDYFEREMQGVVSNKNRIFNLLVLRGLVFSSQTSYNLKELAYSLQKT